MSLVAGFILGIAVFHLLPDSLDHIPGPSAIEKAVGWMVLGMVLMILLQHIFHFHQHDFSREASDLYDDHDHGHGVVHAPSLFGVALGLGVHTATEGIALGTSMRLESPSASRGIPRHSAAQAARWRQLWTNVGFAILCPKWRWRALGGWNWPGRRGGDRLCAVLCGWRVFVHCPERPVTGDSFPQPRPRQAHRLPPRGNQSRLCTLNPAPFMAHEVHR